MEGPTIPFSRGPRLSPRQDLYGIKFGISESPGVRGFYVLTIYQEVRADEVGEGENSKTQVFSLSTF